MNNLYEYIFHYNPYKKFWYGFKHENLTNYLAGSRKGVMWDVDLDELVTQIIIKESKKNAG